MTTSRLILISFFLVAITASSGVVGQTESTPGPEAQYNGPALSTEVVFSVDGGPIKPNVTYYIRFMEYDMWICKMNPASSNLQVCPHRPIMFTTPTIKPTPVMFVLPPTNNDTFIRESTKVSIKFVSEANSDECNWGSSFWRVEGGEVVLNGAAGRADSLFDIHMTDSYYKLTIGESRYPDVFPTSISLTNTGNKDRLLAQPRSGEMEVNFYQNYPPEY